MRFHQTAELVLQLGKAKRDGSLDAMPGDIGGADLIILDEFGYVPFDIDGARLLHRIIAGGYGRRSIASATNIGSANGARSSRTTSSRPQSSTGSCTMDACSSSPGRATASARRSCSEGRPPAPRPNPRRRQRNRPERSLAKIEIFS